MTKIPVIIAAVNEERYIGSTLAGLDETTVEPWVIVNGSHDRTADVAREFGANVYELPEPSKIKAVQHGLRRLNERALGPVLYTDADSAPVFPRQWAGQMLQALGEDLKVAGGMCVAAAEEPLGRRIVMSGLRIANALEKGLRGEDHIHGANMITRMGDQETLDRVLALEHCWPRDDIAMASAIAGPEPKKLSKDPRTLMATSSRYLVSPWAALRHGKNWARQTTHDNRAVRATIPAPRTDERRPIIMPDVFDIDVIKR